MTDADLVAALRQIVDDELKLENYENSKPESERRDMIMLRADAFQLVRHLVNRHRPTSSQ
jgi:hypothetical protein